MDDRTEALRGTQTDTRSSRAQPLWNQCCMKITLLPRCDAWGEGKQDSIPLDNQQKPISKLYNKLSWHNVYTM